MDCIKRFAPAVLATAAMFCSTFANFNCRSIEFVGNGRVVLDAGPFAYRTIDAFEFDGELYFYNTCRSYRALRNDFDYDYEVDSKTKVVRAFAIMAAVTGLIGMVLAYVLPFSKSVSAQMWQGIGVLLVITCLFQGLSLILLSSSICLDNPAVSFLKGFSPRFIDGVLPNECAIGAGYRTNIAATALFFVAGAFALVNSPPEDDESNPVTLATGNPPEEEQAPPAEGEESK